MIDIRQGKVVSKIHAAGNCRLPAGKQEWNFNRIQSDLEAGLGTHKFNELMESISAIHYAIASHVIVTGHRNGDLVIWK